MGNANPGKKGDQVENGKKGKKTGNFNISSHIYSQENKKCVQTLVLSWMVK